MSRGADPLDHGHGPDSAPGGDWEDAPPDPAATIEALGKLGYDAGSALADLIDNSIAASSSRIEVVLHWSGSSSWVAVVDDGTGMDEQTLRQAMRIGSRDPLVERSEGDLGRYGMGLKTASFAQCRVLTVVSRTTSGATPSVRSWDLDHVRSVGRWDLGRTLPAAARPVLQAVDHGSRGTLVVWQKLDDLVEPGSRTEDEGAKARFLERIAAIEQHLAMVFTRYLRRRRSPLRLLINGQPVAGWDPFLESHASTQRLERERLLLRDHPITVEPYVLPHRSKLSEPEYVVAGGPAGWNAQQGFYVFRKDRLIVAGDWLQLGFTRDDSHNLARISVEVPAALDRDWFLNVTKATIRPPAALRGDLRRIAKVTRTRASAAVHGRGPIVGRRRGRGVVPVWRQRRRRGELVFGINRDHPIIAKLLADVGERRSEVAAVIELIEATVPVPALPVNEPEDRDVFRGRPPEAVIALATALYEAELARGLSRAKAAERVACCEPFDRYPDLIGSIWGEL